MHSRLTLAFFMSFDVAQSAYDRDQATLPRSPSPTGLSHGHIEPSWARRCPHRPLPCNLSLTAPQPAPIPRWAPCHRAGCSQERTPLVVSGAEPPSQRPLLCCQVCCPILETPLMVSGADPHPRDPSYGIRRGTPSLRPPLFILPPHPPPQHPHHQQPPF